MSIDVKIKKKLKEFILDIQFRADAPIAILGHSGSGKSVMLKCIAGILTPDEGQIKLTNITFFDKQEKINLRPQRRKVGYLFQDYALFPTMNVSENIGSGLLMQKKEKSCKVDELISRFRLEGLEGHFPRQLSGGQQQRVALARVMAYEPDILLLDEPFSALDIFLRKQILNETLELLKDYTGDMIVVTHDPVEALKVCSHFLVLDNGKCVAKNDEGGLCILTQESNLSPESRLLLSYLSSPQSPDALTQAQT